jgi:RNA polymerase sigma-70 factor (ECF subfamily)
MARLTPLETQTGIQKDEELLAQACGSQPEAFAELVRRYETRLFNFLWGLVRHRETAKDLFQDTWMKAYAARHQFRGQAKFSTWLYSIALNLARDSKRGSLKKLSLEGSVEAGEGWQDRLVERRPNALEQLLQQEWQERYLDASARLPPLQREAFMLIYQQGLDPREAATVLKKAPGHVRVLVHRAVQRLKVLLSEKR